MIFEMLRATIVSGLVRLTLRRYLRHPVPAVISVWFVDKCRYLLICFNGG